VQVWNEAFVTYFKKVLAFCLLRLTVLKKPYLVTCLLTYLLTQLLACLLTCLLTQLLAYLFACLLDCLLT
jgi:hypothetical protein